MAVVLHRRSRYKKLMHSIKCPIQHQPSNTVVFGCAQSTAIHSRNKTWQIRLDTVSNNAKLNKGLNEQSLHQEFQPTSNTHFAVHRLIHEAQSTQEILDILRNHQKSITNGSVYGLAMNQCVKMNKESYRPLRKVMMLLLSQKSVRIELVAFNIFLNLLSRYDAPQIAREYFKIMENRHGLKPDLFTFSSLIKSCRYRGDDKLAEKYWNRMISKYHIAPNEFIINEMLTVYTKSGNTKNAEKIFNQYLNDFAGRYSTVIFNGYLNVFASNGNVDGMRKCIELMINHQIKMDQITMTHLMNGYVEGKRPKKALKVFDRIQNVLKLTPSAAQLFYKAVALRMIMEKETEYETRKGLFHEIEKIVYNEFDRLKIRRTPMIGKVLFEAAIILYHDTNSSEMISVFESLMKQKLIGYWNENKCSDSKEMLVDLHGFAPLHCQFILRYVMTYELQDLMRSGYRVGILCGVGKHSSSKGKRGRLQQFVMDELMRYNPPIRCAIDPKQRGILFLNDSDLQRYERENKQCGTRKLITLM